MLPIILPIYGIWVSQNTDKLFDSIFYELYTSFLKIFIQYFTFPLQWNLVLLSFYFVFYGLVNNGQAVSPAIVLVMFITSDITTILWMIVLQYWFNILIYSARSKCDY